MEKLIAMQFNKEEKCISKEKRGETDRRHWDAGSCCKFDGTILDETISGLSKWETSLQISLSLND